MKLFTHVASFMLFALPLFASAQTTPLRILEAWHKGTPSKRFWRGTKAPDDQGIRAAVFPCNTREFYASPEFAAQ